MTRALLHRAALLNGLCIGVLSFLAACDGGSGGEPVNEMTPTPGPSNVVQPLFGRPFAGDYPLLNYFDHDHPDPIADKNGYQLTWRAARAVPGIHIQGYDGHTGIDWIMPVGTPLYAMADGLVTFAGPTQPQYCFLQDEVNSTIAVSIGHRTSTNEVYVSRFTHMSRVDVAVGDRVTAGQQVGLSGATGCVGKAGTPHVHLEVSRISNTNNGAPTSVDPYGWEGAGVDPWSVNPRGATSVWLWRDGQAPALFAQ